MRGLCSAEILRIWESGQGGRPLDRAVLILAAACPERPPEQLERLPIGRRDDLLFEVRERTFGSDLTVFTPCPSCKGRAEFQVSTRELRHWAGSAPEAMDLEAEGWRVRYRLPTSADLAEALLEPDPESARRRLIGACVLEASSGAELRAAGGLPTGLVDRIEEVMAECDAASEIRLRFECPTCSAPGEVLLDIAAILWEELSAQAQRLLLEVHLLASSYGWSEADILSLSPVRRNAYLERLA